jgi:predicted nicotinamide N-methyase
MPQYFCKKMASDSDDDDDLAVGFMFDDAAAKHEKVYRLGKGDRQVSVTVCIIDDEPGAVQSGHYCWPAAPELGHYIVDTFAQHKTEWRRVVELGCGCALVGLAAAQCPGCALAVFTDHDEGVLRQVEQSIGCIGSKRVRNLCSVAHLAWGPKARVVDDAGQALRFDLAIASDVFYSSDVIAPFFDAVDALLDDGGQCLVLTSIERPADIDRAIEKALETHSLVETRIWDRNESRLQLFSRVSSSH